MSNIVADVYAQCTDDPGAGGREAVVYDAIVAYISPRNEVRRLLPHRARRMVGAWCFVDVYGPDQLGDGPGMTVAPHPHMGLQTVSWLVSGAVVHRDSLGTTALVQPGRAAVMTAGHGIAHSESSPPPGADRPPLLHGAQLWVALPSWARDGDHAFELLDPAPVLSVGGLRAQVFLGRLGGVRGAGQGVTPLLGAELSGGRPEEGGSEEASSGTVPLDPAYEHLLVPLAGAARVAGRVVTAGQAVYLGTDRRALEVELTPGARALLLGGEPFEEEIVMWWNFVGRSHEEIELARAQWNGREGRFGEVAHYPGPERLAAPELPNVRLRPRGRTA